MSEADNIALSLRAVAEHEDLTGTSFDIVNEAAATIDKLEKRIGELETLQFTPTGDNHHNALKCPYCNPERIDPAAERQRREEAERAGIERAVNWHEGQARKTMIAHKILFHQNSATDLRKLSPSESDNPPKVAG